MSNPLNVQIAGQHYTNLLIQPILLSYIVAGGDSVFTKAAKYLSRDKGDKLVNLQKALHCVQLGTLGEGIKAYQKALPEAYKALIEVFVKQYGGGEFHTSLLVKVAEGNFRDAEQVAKLIISRYTEEVIKVERTKRFAEALLVDPHKVWYSDLFPDSVGGAI